MAEIKSIYSKESITQYAKENNLDVLNVHQIAAKLMEMEDVISLLDSRVSSLERFLKTK